MIDLVLVQTQQNVVHIVHDQNLVADQVPLHASKHAWWAANSSPKLISAEPLIGA
jgi:hypothetical protein